MNVDESESLCLFECVSDESHIITTGPHSEISRRHHHIDHLSGLIESPTFATPSQFEHKEIVPTNHAAFKPTSQTNKKNIERSQGEELWHSNEYCLNERLQKIDDMVRREELRYA